MSAGFEYRASGRTRQTGLVLVAVWAALALAYLWLDAALWVLGILALFTLPALWDLVRDPKAGMTFTDTGVHWFAGRRDAEVPWSQIGLVRLDTRLDFSVKATFVLVTGRRLRVPFEATPAHETLEAALVARGIKVERHHFSLLG